MQTNDHLKKVTAAGLLVTLGIIFGDIGTSPLYVFSSIIGDRPITKELVYGGISCVFWTLTLQTTFKYIFLTLQADNRGEGGIFSLYALVWRYRHWLYFPAILGAATLLADGIITPPISVSSAIEGLNGVHGLENIIVPGNALTIGIVIGIMTLLFFFQQFGTKVVGSSLGPIMLVWFSMIMFWGIIQVFHFPNIVAAFNPYWAINLLTRYPKGFWLLGAVFLATTGAEALYSDLGHCGRKNIQVSWIFVKIALLANYFGQAAWLLHSGKTTLQGLNPFYEIMPHWFLIPAIIIATLATIIASQALISGSFTLISEAVSMNFWPKITIKYPTDVRGQIYIPSINWILYAGCVGMMLYFKDSNSMVVAYGFSITVAMIMTTTLMFYYMKFVRKWPALIIMLILVVFISVESSFFVANIVKLAKRWQFLVFEISLVFTMYVWFKARKISNRFLHFENFQQHFNALQQLSIDASVPKYATHLVYLTKANNKKNIETRIVDSILKKRPKKADVYWFVHINRTDEPYTMEYTIEDMVPNKIMRVDFNLGFRVQPRIHLFFRKVLEDTMESCDAKGGARYGCIASHAKELSSDIRYVIIEKFLSVENEFSLKDSFILKSYFAIKGLAQTDKKAFGLDMSDTEIENIPMVIAPVENVKLKRIDQAFISHH